MPDLQIETGGGVIKPEDNKWGQDKQKYQEAIGGAAFSFANVAPEKNRAAAPVEEVTSQDKGSVELDDPYSFHQGDRKSRADDPYSFHQGGAADKAANPDFAEKTPDQQYQDILNQAAQKGLPVVVVFGSQSAKDTEKQATQTLKSNMKEGEALYLYVDTDKLDPNSDLGKVARRNAGAGQGLGESGKSDLAFTGIYTVEKKADGSLGLGKSTATFWGGREEISAIMREQMRYAKAATLNLGGETKPDTKPNPQPSDRQEEKNRPLPEPKDKTEPPPPPPPPDKDPSLKPDGTPPDQRNDTDQNKDTDRKEAEERKRKDEEAKEDEAKKLKLKKEREKALQEAGGKNYPIDEYATGWGRFLERNEMEAGPLRDTLDEFGKEMITGEFDGKKLADMMNKIGPSDQTAIADALSLANKELETSGIKLNVELDANKKVSAVELTELAKAGAARVSVRATASGKIESGILSGTSLKELALADASIRLAKKAEPAACP